MAPPSGFGNSGKKEEEKAKETPQASATPTPTPRPQYKLGPSLKGRYDLTVFLSNDRVNEFEFEVNEIRASVGRRSNWIVQMSVALEFGAGSGVAECEAGHIQLRETIRAVLMNQQPLQLLTTNGKLQLKKELISMFNGVLKTAQIRQVYLTEFVVMPTR